MNTTTIALMARTLGAILLMVSLVAITYTTTVVQTTPTPCYFGCPAEPITLTPYASDGILLAVVALGTMWLGYFALPVEDEAEPTLTTPGTTD
ncbi:MAG: hypothetical protein ACLP9K_09755 [Nitrososphaerales archaeon]|jgi:hypothetical protein